MYDYDKICSIAKNLNCKLFLNESMAKHTTFNIGGNADVFIEVNDKASLKSLLRSINERNIPYFVFGNGSNLLVSDKGIRGIVLKLGGKFCNVSLVDDVTIECGAGALLSKACIFALRNSLGGLEFAFGIPGTVGGAAYMNAGAYGSEMKNVLTCCNHVTKSGQEESFFSEDLAFSYRRSVYSNTSHILTGVTIKLKKDDPLHIKQNMDDFIRRRKDKQPLNYPSAGSIFKRPVGNFAGTLIEECGLKGKSIGGAMVSRKHAGFIVNTGEATCQNVIDLIDYIKAVVFEKTGIVLECEVKLVGEI